VRTRTGRSPPGVAANQISPFCIGPAGPVVGRPPVRDRRQGLLARRADDRPTSGRRSH
jgi:hypothetical protein